MKNTMAKLLILLTLFLVSLCTKSQSSDTTYLTPSNSTEQDVQMMIDLIPMLYKDALRLDSCVDVSKIKDSLSSRLKTLLSEKDIAINMQDEIIIGLNAQIDNYVILVDSKSEQIKIVKKKSFWRGFKWGSGTTALILIVIILL